MLALLLFGKARLRILKAQGEVQAQRTAPVSRIPASPQAKVNLGETGSAPLNRGAIATRFASNTDVFFGSGLAFGSSDSDEQAQMKHGFGLRPRIGPSSMKPSTLQGLSSLQSLPIQMQFLTCLDGQLYSCRFVLIKTCYICCLWNICTSVNDPWKIWSWIILQVPQLFTSHSIRVYVYIYIYMYM